MKIKFLTAIVLLIISVCNLKAQNQNTIFGTLIDNYLNYNPTPNQMVKLNTYTLDSLNLWSPISSDSTVSDSIGSFSFTINNLNANNNFYEVVTANCNGTSIIQYFYPTPGVSFTIETCNNNFCAATLNFAFDSLNNNTVNFTCPELLNATSYLIHFGDGTSSSTSLSHTYGSNDLFIGMHATIEVHYANSCIGYANAFVYNYFQGNCGHYFTFQQIGITNDVQFSLQASLSTQTYLWNFGDGSTDSTSNPTHTFLPNQYYTVTLLTSDNTGCSHFTSQNVYVYDACTIQIGSYQNLDSTMNVNFYPISNTWTTSLDSSSIFTWNFGDGSPADNSYYPIHTYVTPGNYNVCLTSVTSAGCNTTTCQTISVYDYLTTCATSLAIQPDYTNSNDYSFTVQPTIPNVWYYYQSASSFIDFGDGTTITQPFDSLGYSNTYYTTHTYNAAGTYIITATTTTALGCVSSTTDTITVLMPNSYNCDISLQSAVYSTALSGYAFSNSINVVNYSWDFGDGTTSNNNTNYVSHVYPSLGSYNVCVTATSANGCVSSDCDTVLVSSFGSIQGYANAYNYLLPDSSYPTFIKVILLQFTSDSASGANSVEIYDAVNTTSYYGYFQFDNVPSGPYTILSVAYSDSLNVDSLFIPTYYLNKQHWYESDTIYPSPFWQAHYLDLIPTTLVNGNGQIGGFIGEEGGFRSSNNGIEKVHVIIYNEYEVPVKHVLTNAQGQYTFNGLSMGTYHIYPEVVGKQTYRATVTISENNTSNMEVDFEIGEAVISATKEVIEKSLVGVFPNPAKNFISINASQKINTIHITDVTGKVLINNRVVEDSNCKVDVNNFSKGIYFYQVSLSNGKVSTGKFIKE